MNIFSRQVNLVRQEGSAAVNGELHRSCTSVLYPQEQRIKCFICDKLHKLEQGFKKIQSFILSGCSFLKEQPLNTEKL